MAASESPRGQLEKFVSEWAALLPAQAGRLSSIFRPLELTPRAHLTLPGATTYTVLFVCRGLLRIYYLSRDGAESNKGFLAENALGGPVAAAALNLPVLYGIQALEPTELLVARYSDFAALFDEHRAFERLGRMVMERSLIAKERRERSLLLKTARERYLDFLSEYPDIASRVPQYHIASYVGVTDVSLSRIKRSLARSVS